MMTDTPTDRERVEALAVELEDEFRCRCDVAYTDRGLHAPECQAYMLPSSVATLRALLSRAEKAEAERDALRGVCQFAVDGYPRVDVTHEEYRVKVCQAARAALNNQEEGK